MAQGNVLGVCACLLTLVLSDEAIAQAHDTLARMMPSSLSGIVTDEYGEPLARAQILIQPGSYAAQTDSTGRFRITAPAGQYNVVFRHIGYLVEDFSWRARSDETTELSVRLNRVAQVLDTVIVRDSHNRVAGSSSITGVVVDTLLQPLKDAQLQLLGTGRHAVTYEAGQFFFSGIAKGNYVLRVRRMGFSPTNVTIRVGGGEEHDVAIRLRPLLQTLATVEVREKSGFGKSGIVWEEFDRRQRWKTSGSVTIERDEFARVGKIPLDGALRFTRAAVLIGESPAIGRQAPIARGRFGGLVLGGLPPIPGDVCVLIDGAQAVRLPLSFFHADEVERVEVFSADTDWTGTIAAKMSAVKGCEGSGGHHPPYFVVWMRGAA